MSALVRRVLRSPFAHDVRRAAPAVGCLLFAYGVLVIPNIVVDVIRAAGR